MYSRIALQPFLEAEEDRRSVCVYKKQCLSQLISSVPAHCRNAAPSSKTRFVRTEAQRTLAESIVMRDVKVRFWGSALSFRQPSAPELCCAPCICPSPSLLCVCSDSLPCRPRRHIKRKQGWKVAEPVYNTKRFVKPDPIRKIGDNIA